MKDYLNEQMRELRQGCKQPIYSGSFDGEEPYNTGWSCGSKAGAGMVLYCNSCWKKMEITQRKINRLEKELEIEK